jgi:beta-N-acetylhexosaminidase
LSDRDLAGDLAGDRGNRPLAAIFGCAGTEISADEIAFFADADPLGFILFGRNVDTPGQVKALVASLREAGGREDAFVLIDQEGGRVARLKPPHWRAYPAARWFGELARVDQIVAAEAVALNSRLIAGDLTNLGIDVDCLPVLDVPGSGAHDVIGDRAYGTDPRMVTMMARAACGGLLAGGVLPVVKHIPGHGRAMSDSHLELPVVDCSLDELASQDFEPFQALAEMPIAMTAHVVYSALDATHPATTSARVIQEVIRGTIGFDGLLLSDDLSMQALDGDLAGRATSASDAGCDVVLHCNGEMVEMTEVAGVIDRLSDAAAERVDRARAMKRDPQPFDAAAADNHLAQLEQGLSG